MFKHRDNIKNLVLVVALAGAFGGAGMVRASAPTAGMRASPTTVDKAAVGLQAGTFSTVTPATRLGPGVTIKGGLPLAQRLHVVVSLKLRNELQLRKFLTGAQPHAMTRSELEATYLPTRSQAQAVADYLTRSGFGGVRIHHGNLLVSADGGVAQVQSAFRTTLVSVRTNDGRDAFANNSPVQIPAMLRGSVQAILGLQTVHVARTVANRPTTADRVGLAVHNPLEFADIYGASDLPPATDVDVAVWGWASMAETVDDLNAFTDMNGLPRVNSRVICTDYAGWGNVVDDDPTCYIYDMGSFEWDMDSQTIIGMTGGVKSMTFYSAAGPWNAFIVDALDEIVNPTIGEPLPAVINASFGECERAQDSNQGGDGSLQTMDALFEIGVAQGQTFSVATGDTGYDECGDGQPNSAEYPSSSPWVVAVAGTTLRASSTIWSRENVWPNSGGSPSSVSTAQPWQAPLTYGDFAGARGPDVAFDGSPNSGASVWNNGELYAIGGTSLATPIFAGAWARILQSNPGLGFAAPYLYTLPAAVLHDVRAGNNGRYLAMPGWDWASGLGSFDVSRAAAVLAPQQPNVDDSQRGGR